MRKFGLIVATVLTVAIALTGTAGIAAEKPKPKSSAEQAAAAAIADRKRQAAQLAASEFVTVRKTVRADFPKFSGVTLDGMTWTNKSLGGNVTVVNLWASWCGPCLEEWPDLQAVANARSDVKWLGVNTMDKEDNAKQFLEQNKSNYAQVFDAKAIVMMSLRTVPNRILPITLILDKRGKIAAWKSGPLTKAQLQRGIKAVLATA